MKIHRLTAKVHLQVVMVGMVLLLISGAVAAEAPDSEEPPRPNTLFVLLDEALEINFPEGVTESHAYAFKIH